MMDSDKLSEIRKWITNNQLALLVFTTPDCGVCNALKPRIDQMAVEFPRLQVRYLNLEKTPEVAGQYGVFAVPVYILSVQGKEAVRFARHFGMHELEGAVERYHSLLGDQ
jgi:thioredoxin-like negative regulator of GroEL